MLKLLFINLKGQMKKSRRQTPKNYNGTKVTSHQIGELIPLFMTKMNRITEIQPSQILAAWPEVIGSRLAAMTHAESFSDEVLYVKVKNSTLHSLLNQHDKLRILRDFRKRFPKTKIRNIVFRIG